MYGGVICRCVAPAALRDINSRCKISYFSPYMCAHIKKKCVKIVVMGHKTRACTFFICVYRIFLVILCPNWANYVTVQRKCQI